MHADRVRAVECRSLLYKLPELRLSHLKVDLPQHRGRQPSGYLVCPGILCRTNLDPVWTLLGLHWPFHKHGPRPNPLRERKPGVVEVAFAVVVTHPVTLCGNYPCPSTRGVTYPGLTYQGIPCDIMAVRRQRTTRDLRTRGRREAGAVSSRRRTEVTQPGQLRNPSGP